MGLRPTEGAKNASDRNHSLWNGCPLLCHPERTRISCLTALTSVTCFSLRENHMQLAEAATLDRKSGEAEGSAGFCGPSWRCFLTERVGLPQ
jgi:hypothetical protein